MRLKRALFLIIALVNFVAALAQEGSNGGHMAFYGVDYDTIQHKRDTIFHVDSAHIAILGTAAAAFNTGMGGLFKQPNINGRPWGNTTYSSTQVTPGTAFSFGFDYVSKEYHNHWFFSLGLEANKFKCSGLVSSVEQTGIGATDTSAYAIDILSLNLPFRLYYRFVKTRSFRFSMGIGVSAGWFISQSNAESNYGAFALSNPANSGTICLRFDIAAGRHTWFAFEPFYSIQMFDATTHIESAGLKVELL